MTATRETPDTVSHRPNTESDKQLFLQRRQLPISDLQRGSACFPLPMAFHIEGALELAALHTALLAIERYHGLLQIQFKDHEGASIETVNISRTEELNVVDLTLGDEHALAEALRLDQTTPFDLWHEPAWRTVIYRINEVNFVVSIGLHPMIFDGLFVDALLRELAVFYSASVRGQDPLAQVQPLPSSCHDFFVGEKRQTQAKNYQEQLNYWLAKLESSRPAEFLCDKLRPTALSGRADIRTLEIAGLVDAKLQHFCKSHEMPLFVVLFAAFRVMHYRLTRQNDATIGTVNSDWNRGETEHTVHHFINMQCIRTVVTDESFEQVAQQIHTTWTESLANQDVAFETIVSGLDKDTDQSCHPLAQIMFAMHAQRGRRQLLLEGLETKSMQCSVMSRFDLEFHIYQETSGLQVDLVFSTDLFSPETIVNQLSLFVNVLEACLNEPKTKIVSLPLLTDAAFLKLDRMGLIKIEETNYPRNSSIVDVFREQTYAHGSRIAVRDSSMEMTYSELDKLSDTLAAWLRKLSLAPEALVGVFASRCCYTIVAFIGILKAGLAYLPFDVKIPGQRMGIILSSLSGQKRIVLVGGCDIPPQIGLDNVEFVHIADTLDAEIEEKTDLYTTTSPSATSLAYVMFTSGSTGQPKGVMVEHRGIIRLAREKRITQHEPDPLVMAHMANLAFDISTWEVYVALLNGGTLICIDAMTALDSLSLLQVFAKNDIRTAVLTPTQFRQYMLDCPTMFASIDILYLGGETLYTRDFREATSKIRGSLINCYGPTENTVTSTMFMLSNDEKYANGVPIGRALSDSGAHVMDPQLRLVPLGVIGELVVTGDGVARGYTDPERDADRFVSVMIAGRMVRAYRTGDFVRHRPTDGELEFFGRMDGQVKIRGQRIELGEIEHVLRSHRAVSDAAVVLQYQDTGEAYLAGFVTIKKGDTRTGERPSSGHETQHVDTWEDQFDAGVYSSVTNVSPGTLGRDFLGWTSMYDSSDIDKAEMNEWLDDTIDTILDGQEPGQVLEIGSGTGMILFNLGDGLQSYVGLDLSQKAVDFITTAVKSIPGLADKVRVHKGSAADVSRLEQPISANLVIMNSVIQYFPSQDYLLKVIKGLLQAESVRTIFIGDVRSYALYPQFLATRAQIMAGDEAPRARIRHMMREMEEVERELLVDPAFFTALPCLLPGRIEHVEILPKRMHAINELSSYRYAAIIHVKAVDELEKERQRIEPLHWLDFERCKMNHDSLLQRLRSVSDSSVIAVSNITNRKTIFSRCLVAALDEMDGEITEKNWLSLVHERVQRTPSLSASDLAQLAEKSGYQVEISWNRQYSQKGGLDAIFHRHQRLNSKEKTRFCFPTDHSNRALEALSSKPTQQHFLCKIRKELDAMLKFQLPAYMITQSITILDAMPMNQNGKVDSKVLSQRRSKRQNIPAIEREPHPDHLLVPEDLVRRLWAQALHIETDSISLDSSFFQLGGDSIAAMKLISSMRRAGIALSIADLFYNPTLFSLAKQINVPGKRVA